MLTLAHSLDLRLRLTRTRFFLYTTQAKQPRYA